MRPQLQTVAQSTQPDEEETYTWQEGWVKYNDTIYEYQEDILTFLVMGIDKNSDVVQADGQADGGQADALFLVVMNPDDKTIKIVGINRNTMTDIDVYDRDGTLLTTVTAQLAVQHGFGDGMEQSCEYQRRAVADLLYNLPIHGYAAVNMSAIPTINDSVGGVRVTVLEDMTKINENFVKDKPLHLIGEEAFWYLKYRDVDVFGSADLRLERQKQYISAFVDAARRAVKKDISIVLDLYRAVSSQMVTDLSLDEVAYLAPILSDYRFDENSFYTMQGETRMGEEFEEFYPDEKALYEMILDVFYKEVDINQ